MHLGSLVAALGSYLAARRSGGRWLIRIEDLDAARTIPRAADELLQTLARHGLESDAPVRFQSTRAGHYRDALETLVAQRAAYRCTCTRAEIAQAGLAGPDGILYPGTCRKGPASGRNAHAWRLRTGSTEMEFSDMVLGRIRQTLAKTTGDCVIWRADGLAAYHLAVVVDDLDQGVNQIVRGADLLFATGTQMWLAQLLGGATAQYGHLPLVLGADGRKLAKRSATPGIDPRQPQVNLKQALSALGQPPPDELKTAPVSELLRWACGAFDLDRIPRTPYCLPGELLPNATWRDGSDPEPIPPHAA